jgi:hypothetical protein
LPANADWRRLGRLKQQWNIDLQANHFLAIGYMISRGLAEAGARQRSGNRH